MFVVSRSKRIAKHLAPHWVRFTSALCSYTFFTLVSCLSWYSNCHAEVELLDRVIASIDGEAITEAELKRYISAQGQTPPKSFDRTKPENVRTVRDFVISRILEKEASKRGVSVSDAEIDAYVLEIQNQNGLDQAGLEKLLQGRGLTLDEYRTQVSSDILRSRIVSAKVGSRINVVDADIERYLKEHPEMAPESGQLYLEEMVFRFDSDSTEAKKLAEQAISQLEMGADFAAVGGKNYVDIGYVAVDELRPEMAEAVERLESGQHSQAIETTTAVYIVRVRSKSEDGEVDPKLRETIRNELYERRFQEELQRYLSEELPKEYAIEILI